MKVAIESTDRIVHMRGEDGSPFRARQWVGVTEDGVEVVAFIALVAVREGQGPEAYARFEAEMHRTYPVQMPVIG